jgi:hypothetical protein
MLLKMRPTGLGHGVYKDVASTRPVPALPIYVPTRPGGRETLRYSNHAAPVEIAKSEFEASWKQWKAWSGWRRPKSAAVGW